MQSIIAAEQPRKLTITSNGSNLLDQRGNKQVLDHILTAGVHHLNLGIADPAPQINASIIRFSSSLRSEELHEIVQRTTASGCRPRFS